MIQNNLLNGYVSLEAVAVEWVGMVPVAVLEEIGLVLILISPLIPLLLLLLVLAVLGVPLVVEREMMVELVP
jgi:hypothetical protein